MEMVNRNEIVQNFDIQVLNKAGKKIWLNVTTLLEPNSPVSRDSKIIHIFRPSPSPMGMEYFCRQIPEVNETLSRSKGLLETFQRANNVTLWVRKFGLSPREGEVLMSLTQGSNARDIASRLGLSTTTVRTHIQRILKKLQVHSMLEAVALALGKNHS